LEFAYFISKNSRSISAKTSRFLCEFLDHYANADIVRKIIDILLKRRNGLKIDKSFYEWVLFNYEKVFTGDHSKMGDKLIKHISARHPRLLDTPLRCWVDSDNNSHLADGPAEIYWDCKIWCYHGKIHREDGPAVEWAEGVKEWFRYDQLHREDGPAREFPDGHQEWYRNGLLHREDGPAMEFPDGHREWWNNGRCHREDGPAVVDKYGEAYWYLNDKELTQTQFNNIMESRKTITRTTIQNNKSLFNDTAKPLIGNTYTITGTLPISRARAIEVIQKAGGKYSSTLNRDSILITGESTRRASSVKKKDAKRYGNKTIQWGDLLEEITPTEAVAAEPTKAAHPTFQSVMDWLLSDKNNIHKTLEAIELVDVKANCEQY
jgi:hypothetical protein